MLSGCYPPPPFLQPRVDNSRLFLSLPTSPSRLRTDSSLAKPGSSMPLATVLLSQQVFPYTNHTIYVQTSGTTSTVVCDMREPLPAKLVQALHDFPMLRCTGSCPTTLVPSCLNKEDYDHGKSQCCHATQAKRSRKTVADISTGCCVSTAMRQRCVQYVYSGMLPQTLAYANIIIQAQLKLAGLAG